METGDPLESMIWSRKSLLSIEELSCDEIIFILEKAKLIKDEGCKNGPIVSSLSGKRIINLFMEPSTRTRVAFEVAAKSLGADIISITGDASSLTKGETLKDTAMNVQALGADAIVIRHFITRVHFFSQEWWMCQSLMLEMVFRKTQAKHCLIYSP